MPNQTPPQNQQAYYAADVELTTPTQAEYIHNFSDLEWDTEHEPHPTSPTQLYHLLTITGLMVIAPYPEEHTLGEHYIAWAPLTSEPTLTIH